MEGTSEEPLTLLPVEIRSRIYNMCVKSDLKNLTLCSKWLRDELVPLLWKDVKVSWNRLEKLTPVLWKNGNSNLRFASELEFNGILSKDYSGYGLVLFLQSCIRERLTSIQFSGFIPVGTIRLMGENLPNLQYLKLIWVRADWEYLPQLAPTLNSLHIRCVYNFKKQHWQGICTMNQLQELEFSHTGTLQVYRNSS